MGAGRDHSGRSDIADRINGERIALAGWSRAILLQLAHPLIAAGVADHSSFRDSPAASVRRLHQTVRAMLGLTFGSADERAKVLSDIRAIHRRVHGRLRESTGAFPAGTPYSAEDPALLLWVHATVVESTVVVYDALVAAVPPDERDAYCRAAAGVAIDLGARPGDMPFDWPSLERYIARMHESGTLVVGTDARAVAGALMHGRLSALAGPAAWANRLLTAGWLPATTRAEYEFPWNAARERHFHRLISTIRALRRPVPRVIARWPEARRDRA